ncbi:uncharacterized protein LOC117178565 [Belonocnema kinseyi]|uniref:uncharacterized protein LOC117178565 n=1 Tax=Belonocnema kinseyi TaxID=2817044 RepID=UPI00143DC809|nr:uncharacterized protein LOC117178565 [Belonocnema kinseyi]
MILARSTEQAQIREVYITGLVNNWLEEHGISLAASKTDVMVLTRQRHYGDLVSLEVTEETVVAAPGARYLGVHVDKKLRHWSHILKAADKASTMVAKLSRLMPNNKGPSERQRKTLMSVAHSIMLYGSEIWVRALNIQKYEYRKRIVSVQRRYALCIASAYRTVSASAVMVVAEVIPIFRLAMERKGVYERSQVKEDRQAVRAKERARTLSEWQQCWSTDTRGRWTVRLIGEVAPWSGRRHEEVNFYLTEFFTGHRHLNAYLNLRNRKENEFCDYCHTEIDNVEHTFYECDRWVYKKHDLETIFGHALIFLNTVTTTLRNQEDWESVVSYVDSILRQ